MKFTKRKHGSKSDQADKPKKRLIQVAGHKIELHPTYGPTSFEFIDLTPQRVKDAYAKRRASQSMKMGGKDD